MLSQKLRELRIKRKLTHDDLALYLKITRQAYSFYESGKREMNFESLCMLADFYSVTTDYLLGRTNVTNTPFDDEEINMIMNFRKLDERGKESVKATLSFEVAHSPHIQNTKKSAM